MFMLYYIRTVLIIAKLTIRVEHTIGKRFVILFWYRFLYNNWHVSLVRVIKSVVYLAHPPGGLTSWILATVTLRAAHIS